MLSKSVLSKQQLNKPRPSKLVVCGEVSYKEYSGGLWQAVMWFSAAIAIGLILGSLFFNFAEAAEGPGGKRYFQIEPKNISMALNEFAMQADSEILFTPDIVAGKQTSGLTGEFTDDEALAKILAGSGLEYKQVDEKVFLVVDPETFEGDAESYKGKSGNVDKRRVIEEITVTATKRETSLQDTAMSITAVGSEEIARRGLVSGADYLNSVPSVRYYETEPGIRRIAIRGIAVNALEQNTVMSYLGEVPLSSSVNFQAPDLKLVDLERVEVLRGPQGTLYGGGSLAGAVRNVPNAPDLGQFGGSLKGGSSLTAHSDDDAYNAVGVLNVPLVEEKLAVRAVGYHYKTAGYKDFVSHPIVEGIAANTGTTVRIEDDVNSSTTTGARASLLWQPSDRFKLSVMLATQEIDIDAGVDLDIAAGGYTHFDLEETDVSRASEVDVANVVMDYDFGWATLTSSSSWLDFSTNTSFSLVAFFPTWPLNNHNETEYDGFYQELRLSSQFDGPLQFVAGLYHEDLNEGSGIDIFWKGSAESLAATGISIGGTNNVFTIRGTQESDQQAVFGEVSYAFNDRWSLTLGGRWFQYDREVRSNLDSFSFAGVPIPPSIVSVEEKNHTLKAGLDYKYNDDTLIYAAVSQGYRIGQGQAAGQARVLCDANNDGVMDGTNAVIRDSIDSDSTTNYEVGVKLGLLENRLTVNTAVYQVDWEDIPIGVAAPSGLCSITVNGGEARVRGVELETQFFVTDNFKLLLSGGYNDTEILTEGIGNKGDSLPTTPDFSGNLGVEYSFDVAGYSSFLRSDYNYVASFDSNVNRTLFPKSGGYGLWSVRTGITLNQFSVELYGNNLTGEDALMHIQHANSGWRLHPRVVGVEFGYRF